MREDKQYQIVDGTYYDAATLPEVVRILESSRRTGARLRLHYGDVETGRDWMDEWDVTGHVSRSMGPVKIPILISSSRSTGGGGILDHCIIKIRTALGGAVLYQHPLYNRPVFTIADDPQGEVPQSAKRYGREPKQYPYAVLENGEVNARFETAAKRSRWFKKMGIPEPVAA